MDIFEFLIPMIVILAIGGSIVYLYTYADKPINYDYKEYNTQIPKLEDLRSLQWSFPYKSKRLHPPSPCFFTREKVEEGAYEEQYLDRDELLDWRYKQEQNDTDTPEYISKIYLAGNK